MEVKYLRQKFKEEQQFDVMQIIRSSGQQTYSLEYVHWLEDKILDNWKNVEYELPDKDVNVLCFHEPSKNFFVCYRTIDCLTSEEKWFSGAMPTHWMEIPDTSNLTNH